MSFCGLQEDDDDLFAVKKAEQRKPKKVVKPLGDDDLFGDSGDIFSDIPSKPKDKRKKKSSTAAPKEDIFAAETVGGLYFSSFVLLLFNLFWAIWKVVS